MKMSLFHPRHRPTVAVLTLALLLPLGVPGTAGAAAARAHAGTAARPSPSSIRSPASTWQLFAQLWRRITAADTTGGSGGPLPTDENGGGIDPNGKPKPAPPHP
jgi:hypothetical protein